MIQRTTEFEIVEEALDGIRVVTIRGEVDVGRKDELSPILLSADRPLLIDLSDVTFMDSSGLAMLVAARRIVNGARYQLALACPCECATARLLELAGVGELFTVFRSREGAVEWLTPG